jgi:hypothetical protein
MSNRKQNNLILFPGVLALLSLFCVPSFGLSDEQYEAMISSPDWSCLFADKVNSAHLSDGSRDTERTISVVNIRCDGLGNNTGFYHIFTIACNARGRDSVYDLKDCATSGFSKTKTWWLGRAILATTTKSSGPFKYNGSCKYESSKPTSLSRIKPNGKYDISCVNPVNCVDSKSSAVHFFLSCDASGLLKADGKSTAICPQVNDCLAKALPLTPAFTQAELDNL